MKAAVIRDNPRRISIEDMPIPEYGDDEALVQVKAVGLCGSDVHGFLDEKSRGRVAGLVMGHEPSGVVAAVGRNVSIRTPLRETKSSSSNRSHPLCIDWQKKYNHANCQYPC